MRSGVQDERGAPAENEAGSEKREGRQKLSPGSHPDPSGGINGALTNPTAMLNSYVASDRLPWTGEQRCKRCTCFWRGKAKGRDKSSVREEPHEVRS